MYGYIYLTRDLFTNKIYIGKHKSSKFLGEKYLGSGTIIQRIIQKCLEENIPLNERFTVSLLDIANTITELNEKEIFYIDKFDSRNPEIGYNLRKGGDCGPGGPMFKGHKHSEETKLQMSKSRRGEKNSNYGNHWKASPELRQLHRELSSGQGNGMWGNHYISITNGIIEKHVPEDQLEYFLSIGFKKGSIQQGRRKGMVYVYKFMEDKYIEKLILKEELDSYIHNGYIRGRLKKNQRNVKQNYESATTIESTL